jgi:hypothetical protein
MTQAGGGRRHGAAGSAASAGKCRSKRSRRGAEGGQRARSAAVRIGDESQQEMLGCEVAIPTPKREASGALQDPPKASGIAAIAIDRWAGPCRLQRDALGLQRARGVRVGPKDGKQQLSAPHGGPAGRACLRAGEPNHLAHMLGCLEPRRPASARSELAVATVCRLARDAQYARQLAERAAGREASPDVQPLEGIELAAELSQHSERRLCIARLGCFLREPAYPPALLLEGCRACRAPLAGAGRLRLSRSAVARRSRHPARGVAGRRLRCGRQSARGLPAWQGRPRRQISRDETGCRTSGVIE